jgi:hypothetical protein
MKLLLRSAAGAFALSLALSVHASAQITESTCAVSEVEFFLAAATQGNAFQCAGWVIGANDSNNLPDVYATMEGWGFSNPSELDKIESPTDPNGGGPFEWDNYGGPFSLGGTYTNFVLSLKAGNNYSLYHFQTAADAFSYDLRNAEVTSGLSHFAIYGGETTTVPEPGTMLLLGTGLLGMAMVRRREDVA